MTDSLHRISTKGLLRALGAKPAYNNLKRYGVSQALIALLELRRNRYTSAEMIIDYIYGWDPNGGPLYSNISLIVHNYNEAHKSSRIMSSGHRGYMIIPRKP